MTDDGRAPFVEVVFPIPADQAFTYRATQDGECAVGYRVVVPFGRRRVTGFVIRTRENPPEGVGELKTVERVVDRQQLFDEATVDLAEWMSRLYLCSLGEALSLMLPGGRRETEPPSLGGTPPPDMQAEFELHEQQSEALRAILDSDPGYFYLYGVTGSGKTEVYLRVAEATLQEGRQVIYLVPEITLTHQVVEAVNERFPGITAVLHSRLTPSQRLREWLRIRSGEARVVVGARSAVFAPVPDLGLIVIDEEHDGAYKSGSTPRYHARQVAMHRCSAHGARLLMGSATPSVEAYYLMKQGRLTKLHLPERLGAGSMPTVEVVDMRREEGTLSRALIQKVRDTASEGRQTILFLNRRGFSHIFHCRSCEYEMKCVQCSVALTYHKERGRMVCHYCGYSTRPPTVCPSCGSLDVGYYGFGTERIEEEIARLFPDLRSFRLDTDSVRKRGVLREVLDQFRSGQIDLLLGTQMVAKGLNFPGLKLVGVVLADTGLHLPDFRAAERTFSLVVQVAGRAGRFFPDGSVVVQTYRPHEPAITYAASGDLEGFYERELAIRQELGFPPFSRIIRIVSRGKNRERQWAALAHFAEELSRIPNRWYQVLGPAECPLAVIAGNHRAHLIIRGRQFGPMHTAVRHVWRMFKAPSGVYLELDVDPVNLL
jgi:primosomal protein N' (replication factor Y)